MKSDTRQELPVRAVSRRAKLARLIVVFLAGSLMGVQAKGHGHSNGAVGSQEVPPEAGRKRGPTLDTGKQHKTPVYPSWRSLGAAQTLEMRGPVDYSIFEDDACYGKCAPCFFRRWKLEALHTSRIHLFWAKVKVQPNGQSYDTYWYVITNSSSQE